MRSTQLVSLLLILAASSLHAAFSVVASRPRFTFWKGSITARCGDLKRGCTEITGVSLHATCEQHPDDWQLRADVAFIPYVYLPSAASSADRHAIAEHELTHIRDFHRAAEAYAHELTDRRFASAERCQAVALEEEAVFPARMQYFGRHSSAVRR